MAQCDQMARFFIVFGHLQQEKNIRKSTTDLPKWQNFVKSGHTGGRSRMGLKRTKMATNGTPKSLI